MSTYQDLLTLAAGELNLLALQDQLSNNTLLQQYCLTRLTAMVDAWNIKPTLAPWYDQFIFNLVAGQQSYLIGPNAPDWNAPRPIRLNPEATNLLLINPALTGPAPPGTTTAPVRIPLSVLSVQRWANISLPTLQNSYPSGVYLDRSMQVGTNVANGQPYTASTIWVWGIPTAVNQIEFFYWHALTVGNLTDNVNASPGYFRAMFLNLAIEIAPRFGAPPSPLTLKLAADALGDIKELNAPDMATRPDHGMPMSKTAGWITKAQFLSGNI